MNEKEKDINISSKRTSLIRKNIILSFLVKGWSGLVEFLLVPITLNCLGDYKNGVWLTISSILVWINQFDIGLGNGLRNKLATYLAHDDKEKAREMVSSTFFMLIFIIIPVTLLLVFLIKICNVYSILNVNNSIITDLDNVIIVALLFVSSTFIFKFIGNFYMGLQLPVVNNLLVTCGQTLALLLTYWVYRSGSHSLMHIAIIYTMSPLVVYLVAYPYTFFYKYRELAPSYKAFNMATIKEVFNLGVKFFLLQIASVLLFWTSNLLISKLLTPALVTPYQIVYRYFTIVLLAFSIICTPYWSATTDAFERNDYEWIRRSKHRLNIMMVLLTTLTVVMTIASGFVYHLWIEMSVGIKVEIPLLLTVMVAVYVNVLIYSMSYSNFLNGFGALRLQMIMTVTAALLFIPLAIVSTSIYKSIYSIVAVMILVNIPGLIVNKIQFSKILNKTARGIWKE